MKYFYEGLDIGTNSVGIACTDENYNLLRAKGKDCWAVRLFDESKTAVERRVKRTARRRLERRKYRIGQLQALFAPFIGDETFFIRLNNSQFFPEDKAACLLGDKNALFSDGEYDDKRFHRQFPTIYHLRKALMSEDVGDLRLYYLALHHIVKYRGHFLFEGNMQDARNIRRLFEKLNADCAATGEENVPLFDADSATKAKTVLLDSSVGRKDKLKNLCALFGVKDSVSKEILSGICGLKFSPAILFGEAFKEEPGISFQTMNDETFESLQSVYGDDYVILEDMRSIYSFIVFEKLLEGQPDISSAMIAVYEKHKSDLSLLKAFLHAHASQEEYNRLFKSAKEKTNYANYIGYTKKGGDKIKVPKCKDEDFLKYLKKFMNELSDGKDTPEYRTITSEIESGTFLPKILHSDNGLFPHQVNEDELVKIAANMVRTHPETKEIAEKLLPLFRFRIPYYVGPLNPHGDNAWIVKYSDEKITPWNFDEVVDKSASNNAFMQKMTNKCTYLHGEDVLPKASVLYQKFNVLNQINKLKINDAAIPVALKQKIFNELFLKYAKVSDKKILDFLVREGVVSEREKSSTTVTGKDGELNASMSSYLQLKKILGDFVDEDLANDGGVCENIILWHTLNTDKNLVVDLIKEKYGDRKIVTDHLKELKGLSFREFGRLSKAFLTDLKAVDPETGELVSVIDLLQTTNENLNEILFDEKYNFGQLIRDRNGDVSSEITYGHVKELYVSPAVRRGIWQALTLSEEYVREIGRAPDKIFIEVTREDGEKGDAGRKLSRKKQLLAKYKDIAASEANNIGIMTNELLSDEISDMRLRSERLYLYFRQLGRCMYSGKEIDLGKINTDLYDVDHILPRTYIKDDSLDNKVLVLRSKNAEKSDSYPLPQGFSDQQKYWNLLLDKQLISDVTYKRLTRTEPLNQDDYNDFINRQKTITDQTVKAVAELLKRKYPDSTIVYSKAKNVSDFKNKFDLFKCRETNDLHHARDAYLNIVAGNVYHTCFSTPMAGFYQKDDEWRTYNLKTMFFRDVKGAWVKGETIKTVKKTYFKTSMSVSKYSFCNKNNFYDETIRPHTDDAITAPRKGRGPLSDVKKYGGYKSQTTAYFTVVESDDKKGRRIKSIEAIPVLLSYQSKNDPDAIRKYLESKYTNPTVLVPRIKVQQLLRINGVLVRIASIQGNYIGLHNAVQLFTDNRQDEYVNALLKLSEADKNGLWEEQEVYVVKTNRAGEIKLAVTRERNEELYRALTEKLDSDRYRGLSCMNTYRTNLEKSFGTFQRLTVAQQAKILLQILKFFKCNAELSDLSLLGLGSFVGKVLINKNITDSEVYLIHSSPCGLTVRERRI